MARLVLVQVGIKDGLPIFSPLDAEDEKIINGQVTLVVDTKGNKSKRTALQNRAIRKFWSMLAEGLNNAGLDWRKVLKPEVEVPWSESMAGEMLWRPVQKAMYNTESTTQLETGHVKEVYETLNRHLSQKFGLHVPFPERHWQLYESENR